VFRKPVRFTGSFIVDAATLQHEAFIFERLVVPPEFAQALTALRFSSEDEARMRELMERNNQGALTPDEAAQMEAFRRIGSFLAIIQAKARLHLQQGNGSHHAA
jgi:hypothetical protein